MKELILKQLDNMVDALDIIAINDLLGLKTAEELRELQETLDLLEKEFIVYKTKKGKYLLIKNMANMKVGKLSVSKKGIGFLCVPNAEDIKIPNGSLNGAVHEDMVLCEVLKNGEGQVIKVLKRELNNLVGELVLKNNKLVLELDDEKRDLTILLDEDSLKNCVEGHKVLVEITKEISTKKYKGKVIKIIGHKTDPGVDILSIAYKYGIFEEFPSEVGEQVDGVSTSVLEKELAGRKDLTNKLIFTIDGSDTKDIDDAISLEMDGEYYHLGVHIADVSHYVTKGSPLDKEAYKRGTSSYLADTVIPMLPRKLSNGICSLNEGEIRLTLSCEMKIDKQGKVLEADIFESYIKSAKKMTYEKVNDIIMRNIVDTEYEPFKDVLIKMNELAKILRKEKEQRGYIDFELEEAKVVQDETGKAIDIKRRHREDGEKLIEDFMIAANESVAERFTHLDLPFIYRVHDIPDSDKIARFLNLIKILGYQVTSKKNDFSNKGLQKLLEELSDKKEFTIISALLLRSMRKAVYQTNNIGHYGLASKMYCHFTSPIRRYPDLMVHRLSRLFLFENKINMETINNVNMDLNEIALQCSEREQAAEKAERDVEDMKMAEYMESHIGEEFHGIISTITNYGFFVELENLIEGLVHINTLKGDFYVYVEELLSLIGQSTKKTYRLGDEVNVKLIGASKESSTIDFELVGDKNGNKK